MGIEIERKFIIDESIAQELLKKSNNGFFPQKIIEQGYLTTDPVIRVRKSNENYYLTYKGSGMLSREEYNLPLSISAYETLKSKVSGIIISKVRLEIPYDKYIIELDVFQPPYAGLCIAEVEFNSEAEAHSFIKPEWFGDDVTFNYRYSNSFLSSIKK